MRAAPSVPVLITLLLSAPALAADDVGAILGGLRRKSAQDSAPIPRTASIDEPGLRALYSARVFPAVKAAVEDYGFKVTGQSCNAAAGFTLSSLRRLGVGGFQLREGALHVFVQQEGGGLILDSAIAQFFKPGTPPREAFERFGFAGTEGELRALVRDNIEHWDFTGQMKPLNPEVLAVARGAESRTIERAYALQTVATYVDLAEYTFFPPSREPGLLHQKASEQVAFAEDKDLARRFGELGRDQTERMRRAYAVLEARLSAR
jgi:hypothetical protein